MRVIKFRCWQKTDWDENDEPKWQMIGAENLAFENYEPLVDLLSSDPDSEIFMQYTGLLDKNGKEIYEGDIMKLESFIDDKNFIVPVIFKDGMFEAKGTGLLIHAIEMNNGIVIGNIYENPELLK